MHQQLMHQQQPSLATSFTTSNLTTDHIQQYLDENKALILKILENQNSGKLGECAENQARFQRNLVYLAAIADYQPQAGMNYTHHQHSQQMASQSHTSGQSPLMYAQPHAYSVLQQQHTLHSQLTISSTGMNAPHSEVSMAGGGAFPDFGLSISGDGLEGVSRLPHRLRNEENASTGSDEDHGSNSRKQVKYNIEKT